MRTTWILTLAILATAGLFVVEVNAAKTRPAKNDPMKMSKYPASRRVDQVDEYHGVKVPDPYRWLETDVRESPEVAAWVAEQNKIALAYLDSIPERPAIAKRLTELWNYERYSTPLEKGGKYFYSKNDGLQNQSVLYVADSYKADGRVLIDPNKWSKDGTIALSGYSATDDARYLAYARTESG